MDNSVRPVVALSSAAAFALLASSARAVVLLPISGTQTGITADSNSEPAGATLLAGPFQTTVSTTDTGSVQFTEEIFKETGGTLDFLFQAKNLGTVTLASLSPSTYTGFSTTVGFETTSPSGFATGTVGTSAVSRNTGSALTYTFTGGLAAGATSDVFVAQTNAGNFNLLGAAQLADSGGTGSISTLYQPVPEPVSALTLTAGPLLGRRRKPA